jgi:hypothetical protein
MEEESSGINSSDALSNTGFEVGVFVGIAFSILAWICVFCGKKVHVFCCIKTPKKKENIQNAVVLPVEECKEGQYRSDSESDDDGEGDRVSKQAQKRSKKQGSV